MPNVRFLATVEVAGATVRAGTCLTLTEDELAALPAGTTEPWPKPAPPPEAAPEAATPPARPKPPTPTEGV